MTDLNDEALELNDVELEIVSGGMDCKTGTALSNFYYGLADCMKAIGNTPLYLVFTGMGSGIATGACG
jgi:hypothetical protein